MTTMQITNDIGALDAFYRQRPAWSASELHERMQSTTVTVPLDYGDPGGERLSVAVSRLPPTGTRHRVLVAIASGPGGNDGLGLAIHERLAGTPLNEVYDLVGFDPRGYGRSTPNLMCEVSPKQAGFASRPADDTLPVIAADMQEAERGCQRRAGTLRPHVNTRNIARDLDVIREVLGAETINFLGYAYGTYLGAVYGSMFPQRLDRSVLDSCVHPDWPWRKQFMMQADAMRRNVDAWAAWVGARDWRFGLGTSAEEVLAEVERLGAALAAEPRHGVNQTVLDGAVGNGATLRPGWADLADAVRGLRDGSGDVAGAAETAARLAGGGLRNQARSTSAGDAGGPQLRPGVLEAVTCEAEWPTDLEVYYADMRAFRESYPYGYGVLRAQPWVGTFRTFTSPEPLTTLERLGYPAGLVVQAEGDPIDHGEGGRAMAERLGHHLIWVADDGGHELYPEAGNQTVNEYVTRYLMTGELPPRLVACAGAPRPDIPPDSQ